MTDRKFLIDTNIFIGLEDQKEVPPELAEMANLCSQNHVRLFVHEDALKDINRDKDAIRRKISLSKLSKFERLKGIPLPPESELEERFGKISKVNDKVDVALLHALDIGAIDFVVTQDQGIHSRARRLVPSLGERVFFIADAFSWLRTTFEPTKVQLPFIKEMLAHEVSLKDEIFDSLREGYPGFDDWWRNKCVNEHRPCWVATINNELAAIVVRKEEKAAEATTKYSGTKILKICTFKVKPKYRGQKLGEQLLKQILWFAQKNSFDLVYLTTFPNQTSLISVLEYFGFECTKNIAAGEQVFEKKLSTEKLTVKPGDDLFYLARTHYPRFVCVPPAETFCVPIQSNFHNALFPELANRFPELANLFQDDLFGASSYYGPLAAIPGNTIRKVYLCRAQINKLNPGSVIVFYRSKSKGYIASQSVTSVGVVEAVTSATSLEELIRLTAKRSVYSQERLAKFGASEKSPVKVIDFLLIGHFDPPLALSDLKESGVFNGSPPQSICKLSADRFEPLRQKMKFGFQV